MEADFLFKRAQLFSVPPLHIKLLFNLILLTNYAAVHRIGYRTVAENAVHYFGYEVDNRIPENERYAHENSDNNNYFNGSHPLFFANKSVYTTQHVYTSSFSKLF